ncbi:MAG TPA: cysteine hydrolase [Acidimicrobiales bacterium]|nr:cysteine hydrolase [Acidimicrobiales bacterium]
MTDDRLAVLVDPAHTAVLTMELQRGVVGSEAMFPALVERVSDTGLLATVGSLCSAAREAGARVVHCTVKNRPDGAGGSVNCKVFAISDKMRREQGIDPIAEGTLGAELVDELGSDDRDIEVARIHGMTPFTSTSLDQILRNLGVTTVVATGVSVNLGVLGMALGAVDLGYQVVIPRDAVAGVPAAYADDVLDHTLNLVATLTTTADIVAAWA